MVHFHTHCTADNRLSSTGIALWSCSQAVGNTLLTRYEEHPSCPRYREIPRCELLLGAAARPEEMQLSDVFLGMTPTTELPNACDPVQRRRLQRRGQVVCATVPANVPRTVLYSHIADSCGPHARQLPVTRGPSWDPDGTKRRTLSSKKGRLTQPKALVPLSLDIGHGSSCGFALGRADRRQ